MKKIAEICCQFFTKYFV